MYQKQGQKHWQQQQQRQSHGYVSKQQQQQQQQQQPHQYRKQQSESLRLLQQTQRMHGQISKLLQESDLLTLKVAKTVVSVRPRGILSGHLVITPDRASVFFPPFSVNAPPTASQGKPIPLRLSESMWGSGGIVFSCYMSSELVIEDVLVWNGTPLFQTTPFEKRWARIEEFLEHWQPDDLLQGCKIRFADYTTLADCKEPEELQVLEFVPNQANSRRLVWIPPTDGGDTAVQEWVARREAGPDLFSLWSKEGEKQPNLALIRTLAVSKLMRSVDVPEFMVSTVWNKQFSRWEITGLVKNQTIE